MGLLDFVKDAGERLFKGRESKEQSNQEAAAALTSVVTNLGLRAKDLQIGYADGLATVRGVTP